MPDIEKVVAGLRCISGETVMCKDCGYSKNESGTYDCKARCALDALEIMKEQEAVVRCKDCKWYQAGIDINGKPFTRCNGDVRVYGHTKPEWFCADVERRDGDD